MKTENREIGQAVKNLIVESGISQTAVAERLGISKSSLSQMLSGVAPLPFERFRKIAEMLRMPEDAAEAIRRLYVRREAQKLAGRSPGLLADELAGELARGEAFPQFSPAAPGTIRNTPELRETIKDAMMSRRISSAAELNRLIGYDSFHTLERLLSGKLNWFPDMLSAVFDHLGIAHDEAPMSPAERMLLTPEGLYRSGAHLVRPIPVVDWANAADYIGNLVTGGTALPEKWDPENTEVIAAPVGARKGAVSFRVSGQSMEPKILDGDRLICEPVPRLEDVPSNKVVVVRFAEDYPDCPGCVVCKRLRRIAGMICLTSDNQSGRIFENILPQHILWAGAVTAKYSDDL